MAKQAVISPGRKRPAPPAPAPERPSGKTVTTMHIKPETLAELKKLAADRRCRVNDLVIEAVGALLDRAGR